MALQQGMELLKNSSKNFTDEELTPDALLGITATICCIVCLMVLIALSVYARCYSRSTVCGTTIKRLAVGFIVSTMLYQFVVALHLVRYFEPDMENMCELQGFLIQYTSSVSLLLALGISLVLFFEALKVTTCWKFECYKKVKQSTFTCCDRKINKLEVILYTSAFSLPLLFDWIPFITNSYGPSQNFCWFRSIADKNSSEHSSYKAGLWEEIWLSAAPLGVVVFLILLLLTASLCQLCYGIKNARVERRALIEVGVTNSIFFIASFIAAMVLLPFHGSFNTSLRSLQFTVIFAPIAVMLLPLALLVAIHLPFSSKITRLCFKHSRYSHTSEECGQTTVHKSSNRQQPSHTTWTSPHSFNESSELTPFVKCEQQKDYGTVHGKNVN